MTKQSNIITVKTELLVIDDYEINPEEIKKYASMMKEAKYLKNWICPIVTQSGKSYKVLFGNKRVAAAKLAGITEIPVMLEEVLNEESRLELQKAENDLRRSI